MPKEKLKPVIKLKGRIINEQDFWVRIHLQNSGMIIDFMKKDLEFEQEDKG